MIVYVADRESSPGAVCADGGQQVPASPRGFMAGVGEADVLYRQCPAAIAFALRDPRDYDADAETITLDVNVAPSA